MPVGTNLYGTHPIYFEHRTTGTHGVFLLNSNGMDVKLTDGGLEYNLIGGIFDFYFIAGPTAIDVAKQYAKIVGTPAEMPYWGERSPYMLSSSLRYIWCRFRFSSMPLWLS